MCTIYYVSQILWISASEWIDRYGRGDRRNVELLCATNTVQWKAKCHLLVRPIGRIGSFFFQNIVCCCNETNTTNLHITYFKIKKSHTHTDRNKSTDTDTETVTYRTHGNKRQMNTAFDMHLSWSGLNSTFRRSFTHVCLFYKYILFNSVPFVLVVRCFVSFSLFVGFRLFSCALAISDSVYLFLSLSHSVYLSLCFSCFVVRELFWGCWP